MKRTVVNLLFLAAALSIFAEFAVDVGVVNLNITNTLILIIGSLMCLRVLLRKKLPIYTAKIFILSSLLVVFYTTSLRVESVAGHLRTVITLSKGLVLVILVVYWLDRYEEVRLVAMGLVIAGIIALTGSFLQGYVGIGENFFPGSPDTSRLRKLGFRTNVVRTPGLLEGWGLFGVYVESAALLCATGFLRQGRRQGVPVLVAYAGLGVAFIGLIMSQSRSGLVSTLVGYAVFFILYLKVYSEYNFIKLTPLITMCVAILVWLSYPLVNVIYSLNVEAVITRLVGYEKALEEMYRNPVFGIGFDNVSDKLKYYHSVHNGYLNVAASGGLIAFLLYAYLNVKAIKGGLHCLSPFDQRAPLAIALLSAFAATVVETMLWAGGAFASAPYLIIGLLIALGRSNFRHPVGA
ncbi:O-antigen ligase family protein [Salinibacter ruber]|uniref:O-antigen ligase family protein n=1 Tax=Salinibacter ruber TaxID=146919 RepID=UPI002072ADF5|nr:O-antigen ligase family protein [Salinibacter ruber]